MWIFYAVGSAFFAGVTSILTKCCIRKQEALMEICCAFPSPLITRAGADSRRYTAITGDVVINVASPLQNLTTNLKSRISELVLPKSLALFIRTFKKLPKTMTEWNDTVWTMMVEKAIVHMNGGHVYF